jgi:hypothetical protein
MKKLRHTMHTMMKNFRYLTILVILALVISVVGLSVHVFSAKPVATTPAKAGSPARPAAPPASPGKATSPVVAKAPFNATVPPLGTASTFAILAGTSVNNIGASSITGDVGVAPGTTTPGLLPTMVVGALHLNDAAAIQAKADLVTARSNLAGQACTTTYPNPQELGGLTLTPGVYCFGSTAQVSGTLTLDSQGDPAAVFVFKIPSTLTTLAGSAIVMSGTTGCGAFWSVDSADIAAGMTFPGSILAATNITLGTGASISAGRALASSGAVTLDTNTLTIAPCAAPTPGTLAENLNCDGVHFSGEAVIATTLAYTLSRGGPASQPVGPGPFAFDVPWSPIIQGLAGPFRVSANAVLDLSAVPAANVTITSTRTLTCSANG